MKKLANSKKQMLIRLAAFVLHIAAVVCASQTVSASGNGWSVLLLGEEDRVPYFQSTVTGNTNNGTTNVLLYSSVDQLDARAVAFRGASTTVMTVGRACQPTAQTTDPVTRFLMLKLATSGSTWIGDLLGAQKGVNMKPEIVTGSSAHHMRRTRVISTIGGYLSKHIKGEEAGNTVIVGCSVNDKNMANIDFPALALGNRARLVVWIRSNLVSHAVGKVRAEALHSKCHTNNVRLHQAKKCALPEREAIPLQKFQHALAEISIYHALHMGAAYRRWGGSSSRGGSGGDDCGGGGGGGYPPVFELFYEEMLADKERALRRLFSWLGHGELLGGVGGETSGGNQSSHGGGSSAAAPALQDKTVKSTPAGLRSLLANFEELEAFLLRRAPCFAAHLRSGGKEVMPICPPFASLSTAEGAAEVHEMVAKLAKTKFPQAKSKQSGHLNPFPPRDHRRTLQGSENFLLDEEKIVAETQSRAGGGVKGPKKRRHRNDHTSSVEDSSVGSDVIEVRTDPEAVKRELEVDGLSLRNTSLRSGISVHSACCRIM